MISILTNLCIDPPMLQVCAALTKDGYRDKVTTNFPDILTAYIQQWGVNGQHISEEDKKNKARVSTTLQVGWLIPLSLRFPHRSTFKDNSAAPLDKDSSSPETQLLTDSNCPTRGTSGSSMELSKFLSHKLTTCRVNGSR